MDVNRKIALLAMAIIAMMGSVLAANTMFTSAAYAGLMRMANHGDNYFDGSWSLFDRMRGGPSAPAYGNQNWSANVTIDALQAKALVDVAIHSLRVGTVTALRTGWLVPIEDGKGVVA